MSSLYLAELDPNPAIPSAIEVRREILFQLLMWDSIVISDSQLLTYPGINLLMGDDSISEISEELSRHLNMVNPDVRFKGFEKLLQEGLVQVAHRKNDNGEARFRDLWNGMKNNQSLFYLTRNERYCDYLDNLDITERSYEISNVAKRFKNNLQVGVKSDLKPLNYEEKKLVEMFNKDDVLFRELLDCLNKMKDNTHITEQRYQEIYNYIYSCYSINVPAEINCCLSTRFKNIPFHLETSENVPMNRIVPENYDFHPTWALNKDILDYITIDEFIRLRKVITPIYHSDENNNNNVDNHNCDWNGFTERLQEALLFLLEGSVKDRIQKDYDKRLFSFEKCFRELVPTQNVDSSNTWKIVKIFLKATAGLGTIKLGEARPEIAQSLSVAEVIAGIVPQIIEICVNFSRRGILQDIAAEKSNIEKYINGNTKIITKYD